ncbi:hypothetical protein [Streptomyces sp. NBC_01304]|uniref:hypothetical protein n=1 Tax=Streptomyces sp. NBC_01304 TaxID=2903818 RepID=UPI002E0F2BAF|nr:hypothetical protein OG430_10955 [Streptomyces sp. NBC_01304]
MAWDEWNQLKADAAERHSAQMQLNQVAPVEGRGAADLVVRDDDLGKLGAMAYDLRERLRVDSDHARASSFSAGIELLNDGLEVGTALTELNDAWNSKARTLVDACGHISNHLDYTRALSAKEDAKVATSISASRINQYFK